ncbi:MAG: primosomal protein N' [Dehalococcoidia bacterium]|nr:primosomal protein N' [Dehalococcoidia bacterium]
MGYAEVAVNSPIAQRRTFSYSIPPAIALTVGQAVWVPFGSRVLQGVVLELTDHPAVEDTREIAGVIDSKPVLSPIQVQLARWISEYYVAPLFDAIALMLPPGFERKLITFLQLSPGACASDHESLTPEQKQLLSLLEKEGRIALKVVEKTMGKKNTSLALSHLLRQGLITKSEELERIKVRPKFLPYLNLAVEPEVAQQTARNLAHKAPKQAALLEFLANRRSPVAVDEATRQVPCTPAVVKALQNKGLVLTEHIQALRDPLLHHSYSPAVTHIPTATQEAALLQIRASLRPPSEDGAPAFLLYGVTGSGKTEIYLCALAEAVASGKRGIVLVPEIALTPQTIERFASRFPHRVAVLHSKLSLGEQFDVWQQVREGAFDVVVGPRSALFAPQPDLGLIVIDEEHEWTYKQHEQSPRYHARETALKLAELSGAVVILGSATPDVESFYRAQTGRYRLLQLPQRITTRGDSSLPEMEVVDMRQELKAGNRGIFSRSLSKAIAETLAARDQAILFLNRRGTATFVQCRDCGFVLRCRRCDLPLTYHAPEERLTCHQCNYRKSVPTYCPECRSRRIRFLGIGTERVEQEVAHAFPGARTLRWDRDVTRGKNSHERITKAFLSHQADILVGTQMLAKGLDFPQVTLVGIISADTILHFPDFRSCERTFQLLSQVAGRAGRGASPGRAVVQTYTPEHYAIAYASKHDYASFYRQEIAHRRRYENPPYGRLASLTYAHINNDVCQRDSERLHRRLKERIDSEGLEITLIGPSPMFFQKVRGRFRWQIILRGSNPTPLLASLPPPRGWVVDIDPIGLL